MDFMNSSPTELSLVNDDVDLDELDFEVLPWLRNFGEFNIYEDPDHDYANLRSSVNSNETNNNDCENKDKSWIDSNQKKEQFQCDVCFKNIATKGSLKIHKRIHNREKPYACEYCEKQFNQSSDLKRHRRIHTGEKPYGCEFCEKSFTTTSHLTEHRRIHTGEKPYACEFCEKTFAYASALKKHRRIHSVEKP